VSDREISRCLIKTQGWNQMTHIFITSVSTRRLGELYRVRKGWAAVACEPVKEDLSW